MPRIAGAGRERLYNLASGASVTHAQLAGRLGEILGCGVAYAPGALESRFPRICNQRICNEFGFRPRAVLEDLPEPSGSIGRIAGAPGGVTEQRPDHGAMHVRMLAQVDGGQVEAERLDPSQQALDAEQTCMIAAMRAQARDDLAQVALQLRRPGIGV